MTVNGILERTIKRLEARSKNNAAVWRQFLASMSLGLVSISYGMVLAFTGTLLPLIHDYVDEENGTRLAATNTFFMVVGACSSIFLVQWLGNKISLALTQIIALAGWLLLSFAQQFIVFDIACILIGFSSGFAYQISLTCRVEILSPKLRGPISNLISSCYTFGIFVGHLSAIILPWRMAMRCSALVPLLSLLVTIGFFVETPSWLLYRGRTDEAEKTFLWLHGTNEDSQHEFRVMMEKQFTYGPGKRFGGLKNVFSRKFFVPFLIGSTLLTAQSGSGYDLVVIYTVDLLSKMASNVNPAGMTIAFDSVSWISSIFSCYAVKRVARRQLFFISAIGTIMTLILLMIINHYQMPATLFVVCLCTYTAFVNVAVGPVSWLVMAEVFPEESRDLGVCLNTGYFCFLTFLLTEVVPMVVSLGGIIAALGLFSILLFACSVLLYFIMPETKEVSFQEIQEQISLGKLNKFASLFACSPSSTIE